MVNAVAGPLLGLPNPVARTLYDRGGAAVNAADPQFGMAFDGVRVTDGVMNSVTNPTHVTSATAAFPTNCVGMGIAIAGAGAGGVDLTNGTILTRVSATEVITDKTCLTTVSGATVHYGTKNATALAAVNTYANTHGGHIVFPPGATFYLQSSIALSSGIHEIDGNYCTVLKGYSNDNIFNTTGHDHQRMRLHNWIAYGLRNTLQTAGDSFFYSPGNTQSTTADQSHIWVWDIECHDMCYDGVDIFYCNDAQILNIRSYNCNNSPGKLSACSDSFIMNTLLSWDSSTHPTGLNIPSAQVVSPTTETPAAIRNTNITLAFIDVENVPTSEGILLHDADGFTIIGGKAIGTAAGLVLAPSPANGTTNPNIVRNGTVHGYYFKGTSGTTTGSSNISGVNLSGDNRGTNPSVTENVYLYGCVFEAWNVSANSSGSGVQTSGNLKNCGIYGCEFVDGKGSYVNIGTIIGTIDGLDIVGCRGRNLQVGSGGTQKEALLFNDNTNSISGIHLSANLFADATHGISVAANRDLSAAGTVIDDGTNRFRNCTQNYTLGASAKLWNIPVGPSEMFKGVGIPAATARAGAGGSPPVPVVVAGSTDLTGVITFGTGSAPSATNANMVRVSFSAALQTNAIQNIELLPINSATANLGTMFTNNVGTTSFDINSTVGPAASQANTVYGVSYRVILVPVTN